ncbi:MAG: sulfurtransferase [Thermodesulfobacteriota bacterium]
MNNCRAEVFRLFFLVVIAVSLITGCGSSSDSTDGGSPAPGNDTGKPTAAQTGDLSLFPNADLLASATDLVTDEGVMKNMAEWVIVDTRSAADYAAGHIPGAINLQWDSFAVRDGSTPKGSLLPVDSLAAVLGAAGLTEDTAVIFYDDTLASRGSAGRLFWMLEYLGNTRCRILNGGWDKWAADDLPTETTVNTLPAAVFVPDVDASVRADKTGIAARLNHDDFVLVDTRTDEEFTGWRLYDEAREGHVKGAVHLPFAWCFNADKSVLSHAALKTLLESRGITGDKEIAAYSTDGVRSGFLYFLGRLMGYDVIANYDASIREWAEGDDTTYPMEKMAGYSELVYPAWVKALIDYHAPGSATEAPPGYLHDRGHRHIIFETQWGSFEDMANGWADDAYLKGHIPGAVHSNSDTYENGFPRWFLLPEDQLKQALGSMGVTADATVVVYSNNPIFAARLWWILKYAGVQDVRLLNGGYDAWVAAGYESETTVNDSAAVTYDGSVVPGLIAATDYVAANYNTGGAVLADVRTWAEYIGETSGYSYVVNKGRIPGAVWAYNADNPDREYLDDDGTLRSFTEVRGMWAGLGITAAEGSSTFDREVIFYCGSGYRSSLSFLHAHLMGYQNVRNYSDGWEGWSTTYTESPDYVADPAVPGSTDGWLQDPSGRPVASGAP